MQKLYEPLGLRIDSYHPSSREKLSRADLELMERKSQDNLLLLAKKGLGVAHAEISRRNARCNAEVVLLIRLENRKRLWNNKYLVRTIRRDQHIQEKITRPLFGKERHSAL